MASIREQRLFLQSDLQQSKELLEQIGDHPLMSIAYSQKVKDLEEQIQQLPPLGQKEPGITLYFSGGPVVGSHGIDASFAADVMAPFQSMVKEEYAARATGRKNGKRGKVKHTKEAELLLVGLPRGSFGLEFTKSRTETLLDDQQMGDTLAALTDLICASAKNDESFTKSLDCADHRVISSLKNFLKIISDRKAGIRMTTGDYYCDLTPRQATSAYSRVANTEVSNQEERIKGTFKGALLDSMKYDFNDKDGHKMTGSICYDLSISDICKFISSYTNKECIGVFDKYTIQYKNKKERTRYILKDILPVTKELGS